VGGVSEQLEQELNRAQFRFATAHGCNGALALPSGRAAVYRTEGESTVRWIVDERGSVLDTACFEERSG
jgi:hypothetical protein